MSYLDGLLTSHYGESTPFSISDLTLQHQNLKFTNHNNTINNLANHSNGINGMANHSNGINGLTNHSGGINKMTNHNAGSIDDLTNDTNGGVNNIYTSPTPIIQVF